MGGSRAPGLLSTTAIEIDDDAHEVCGQSYWKQRLRSLQVQCSDISVRSGVLVRVYEYK